jgi:hypothetical protein
MEITLSPHDPQARYQAALSRIDPEHTSDAKRHTPIFQRNPAATQRQAVKDAATALRLLWKHPRPHRDSNQELAD